MKGPQLFKARLKNILDQLSSDQSEEVFEWLLTDKRFQPKGYPFDYRSKDFDELTDEEIKFLHDEFIQLQYSEELELQGEDIRGIQIYPYLTD